MRLNSDDYANVIREAGIEIDYAYCHTTEDEKTIKVDRVVARISGDLTFEMLERASVLMGTRKINIVCDLGCESDKSHDTDLVFHDPSPPGPRESSTGRS